MLSTYIHFLSSFGVNWSNWLGQNNVPYTGQWRTETVELPNIDNTTWANTDILKKYTRLKKDQTELYHKAKETYDTLMKKSRQFQYNKPYPEFVKQLSTMEDQYGSKVYLLSNDTLYWTYETPYGKLRTIYTLTDPESGTLTEVFLTSEL